MEWRFRIILPLLLLVLSGGAVAVIFGGHGNLVIGVLWIFGLLLLFLGALGLLFMSIMRSVYNRSIDYITMEQLSPEANPEDFWWESLGKVIPRIRDETVPIPSYSQLQMKLALHVAVKVGKLSSAKRRRQPRNNRATELV